MATDKDEAEGKMNDLPSLPEEKSLPKAYSFSPSTSTPERTPVVALERITISRAAREFMIARGRLSPISENVTPTLLESINALVGRLVTAHVKHVQSHLTSENLNVSIVMWITLDENFGMTQVTGDYLSMYTRLETESLLGNWRQIYAQQVSIQDYGTNILPETFSIGTS